MKDEGGPITSAVEMHLPESVHTMTPSGGLSIRDWFAKEGSQIHAEGLLALGIQPSSRWEEVCHEGLRYADAMLAARKENQ